MEYHLYGDKGYEEVKTAINTTYEQAQKMQAPRAIALCQCFNGSLEFQAGQWDEAESALRESIQLYHDLGAASGEALAQQQLGVLQTARGQLAAAMASFEHGVAVAQHATMRAHCLARLYASMTRNRLIAGDLDSADHYLELGLAMGEGHGNCTTCESLLLPAAVSLHIAKADLEGAAMYCRRLEAAADEYGSRVWVAMARQTRGELEAACGNLTDAVAGYSEAYEAFAEADNVYEAARCRAALAELLARRDAPGDNAKAAAAQDEATEVFERLGAPLQY